MSTPASDVLTPERLADLRRIATGNPRRPDGQIREVQRIRMQWFARHGYLEIKPAPPRSTPEQRSACVTVTALGWQELDADDERRAATKKTQGDGADGQGKGGDRPGRPCAGRSKAAKETSASIAAWADVTFGPVESNMSIWKRANKEFQELRRKLEQNDSHPGAAEECADVRIVLDRLVHRLGCDMQIETDRKMAINRARKWHLTGDGHGQHIDEETP